MFDNLSPLSVTGSLDVGTGTVELKIKGSYFSDNSSVCNGTSRVTKKNTITFSKGE